MEHPSHPHAGHRDRLRETYQKGGIESLSDVNRLELLLFYAIPRRDTNVLAHELLRDFGSFSAVMSAGVDRLMEVKGITKNAAILIQLVGELAAAAEQERTRNSLQGVLRTTSACGEYLLPHFMGASHEMAYLLCLDGKCKLLACRKISDGTVNATDVSVRRILETALHYNAVSVVLAHNHPCGTCLPSTEDEYTTTRIWKALDAVRIQLADHIIVAEGQFYSMADSGFFDIFLR